MKKHVAALIAVTAAVLPNVCVGRAPQYYGQSSVESIEPDTTKTFGYELQVTAGDEVFLWEFNTDGWADFKVRPPASIIDAPRKWNARLIDDQWHQFEVDGKDFKLLTRFFGQRQSVAPTNFRTPRMFFYLLSLDTHHHFRKKLLSDTSNGLGLLEADIRAIGFSDELLGDYPLWADVVGHGPIFKGPVVWDGSLDGIDFKLEIPRYGFLHDWEMRMIVTPEPSSAFLLSCAAAACICISFRSLQRKRNLEAGARS